ncbi:MAG TPA: GTPase, partial [Pirellulales bacterium]|nr:GTPase [Pirellulales bacterium]
TSDAIRAVLIGAANVGKTSLYNALTGQTALVSPRAGTTRDYLRAQLDLDGVVCELIDTAGLISQPTPAISALVAGAGAAIDSAAQQAAAVVRDRADIEILCLDATRPLNAWEQSVLGRPASGDTHSLSADACAFAERKATLCPRIVVLTKLDQPRSGASPRVELPADVSDVIETSSISGVGLERLRARLREIAVAQDSAHASTGTAARCRDSLRQAAAALTHARQLAVSRQGEELVAAELRLALDALGQVVGAVYTDDVLDRIFSRFCIGK